MRISIPRLLSASLFGLLLSLLPPAASSQTTAPNEWTWVGGSITITCPAGNAQCANEATSTGVYGTLGVAAAGNIPGSREGAANWTDSSGHLWLFGGYIGGGTPGNLNDLWEFDPSTNEWTWVGGSGSAFPPGVYGSLETPAAGNIPGGRQYASVWTGTSGNIWLFGGEGIDADGKFGELNDLWKFSLSSKEWTWVGGSSTVISKGYAPATYGTLGKAAAGNTPGGRSMASSWIDGSGNLWLFGGYGIDANGSSFNSLNDLWEFNPSTNEWAWVGGSSVGGLDGVYGTLGTPSTGNIPGSNWKATSWTDSNGNFWLFGGDNGNNVLWEFNPVTKEWTWVAGSISGSGSGVYGTLGTPALGNLPGGRGGASSWTDSSGKIWLFGGNGGGDLNDFWEFNPTNEEWAWMGGSSTLVCNHLLFYYCGQPGISGTQGTPAIGNIPGGRNEGMSWTDSNGNLWIFGGYGEDSSGNYGWLNDLWVYQPYANADTPTFSLAEGNYNSIQTVSISDATAGAIIYFTTDGTTPTTSSTKYTGVITISSTQTLEAIAIANEYVASAVASATYTIIQPGFNITGAPVTVTAGATSGNTSAITLAPVGGFTGNVALTAAITSGPSGGVQPTLSFGSTTPASITGTAAGTASLIITTKASSTTQCTAENRMRQGIPWYSGGGAVLACALLLGIPARRRGWLKMLGVFVLLVALAGGALACGGGGGGTACTPTTITGTTPGTYTITVTGTSGSITSTGTVTLTVQ